MGGELQGPGSAHADHTRLGGRVDGTFFQADDSAGAHQDNPAMMIRFHGRQGCLDHGNRTAEMQLCDRIQVTCCHLFQGFFKSRSCVVDHPGRWSFASGLFKG